MGQGGGNKNWARIWANLAPLAAPTHGKQLPSRSAPSPGFSPCSKRLLTPCLYQGSKSQGEPAVEHPDAVQGSPP